MAHSRADIIEAIREQGRWCGQLGSPVTQALCNALAEVVTDDTRTGRRLLNWPDDLVKSAFVLRIAGGFHALAMLGHAPALAALYDGDEGDWPSIVRDALVNHDDWLNIWLNSPPQTNEVGRAAVLWAGLMVVAARFNQPIDLLELGSSAGLNLNLDRFGYNLGGVRSGDFESSLQLEPEWEGAPPPKNCPVIMSRRGVDMAPINILEQSSVERLKAFIWPGQTKRLANVTAAIAIAQAHPPLIDKADIVDWLRARLAAPQPEGVSRVVMHSITLQYLSPRGRDEVTSLMTHYGSAATEARPLAWVQMEIGGEKHRPELSIQLWPDGAYQKLADVHPHGAHIRWNA